MNIVERIDDRVPIQRVIVSVYEKQGLERFIPGLLAINPEMQFYSTGGTLRQLCDLMGEEKASANLFHFRLHRPSRNAGGVGEDPRFQDLSWAFERDLQ